MLWWWMIVFAGDAMSSSSRGRSSIPTYSPKTYASRSREERDHAGDVVANRVSRDDRAVADDHTASEPAPGPPSRPW